MEENDQPQPAESNAPMPEAKSISQNTTLTIGLVISLFAGLISFTWFVRGLQADVRTMQVDVAGIKQSVQDLGKVNGLATEIRELKQYGSDISRKLALDLIELKRDFELHKVQNLTK